MNIINKIIKINQIYGMSKLLPETSNWKQCMVIVIY